jgi:hypothetical protein
MRTITALGMACGWTKHKREGASGDHAFLPRRSFEWTL